MYSKIDCSTGRIIEDNEDYNGVSHIGRRIRYFSSPINIGWRYSEPFMEGGDTDDKISGASDIFFELHVFERG